MARKKKKVSMRRIVDAEIKSRAERDTPSWPEHQQRARMGDQSFTHPSPGKAVHPSVGKSLANAPSWGPANVGRTRRKHG
jgi:hypothetical protein